MLLPGHLATGYIVSSLLINYTQPVLTAHEVNQLLIWGSVFGCLPDIDMVVAFLRLKSLKLNTQVSHRRFISHTPILWLIIGITIYFLSNTTFWQYMGLLIWFGSWTHFFFDSFEYGIMWLWPFSTRQYAFRKIDDKNNFISENTTKFYWLMFKEVYVKNITFYMEIIAIFIVLYLLLF